MAGYVKLYRTVRKTAIADNPEYFAAWVHLLCMATYTEHDQVVGRTVVKLKPGQLVFGRKRFSAETGITENKVRAALDVMKSLEMITIKSTAKFSVISITNWQKYHDGPPANDQQTASSPPADSQQTATNKKGEEGSKKGEEKSIVPATQDTASEVDHAFDVFWQSGLTKQQKKKAFGIFKRKAGREPMVFAEKLRQDISTRFRLGQFGIDKMHPTTYLNGERWEDEYPSSSEPAINGKNDLESFREQAQEDPFL